MVQLLAGLLIVSAIGALLALFLEVADAYLADYGEKHVVVNGERDLVVEGGRPLLLTLMEEKIFLPSACGGKGTCGTCKARVLEGGGPLLPTELPYLDPEEREGGIRLTCQVKVKQDVHIQIPEDLFRVREYRGRVERIEELSPANKLVDLHILSPTEGITFTPGQYVQLFAPRYGKVRTEEYRAYSIASSASAGDRLSLIITHVPKGIVSTYVHRHLREGDEVRLVGPYGDFRLHDAEGEVLLIATGSGLAPILSILHQIKEEKIQRKATLFFGARTREDLLMHEALQEFEKKIPGFRYLPTLSRATEADDWDGERGRVTDLIDRYVHEAGGLQAYICGSPPVVQSCVDALLAKGVPEAAIFYDKFE